MKRLSNPLRTRSAPLAAPIALALALALCAAPATAQLTRSATGGSISVSLGADGLQLSSGSFRIDASRSSWAFQLVTPGLRFYNSGVVVDGGAFQCQIANTDSTAVRCDRAVGASSQPYAIALQVLDTRTGSSEPIETPNAWIQNR